VYLPAQENYNLFIFVRILSIHLDFSRFHFIVAASQKAKNVTGQVPFCSKNEQVPIILSCRDKACLVSTAAAVRRAYDLTSYQKTIQRKKNLFAFFKRAIYFRMRSKTRIKKKKSEKPKKRLIVPANPERT